MSAAKRRPANVISLAEARAASPDEIEHPPYSAPASKSGYLDLWYKQHEDPQALLQESWKLQQDNAHWKRTYHNLKPTLAENALYYASVLGILATLLIWAGLIVLKGL